MTELAFISLKTMDGKPCGFVRLSGGFAEIRLLEPLAGQAAVLTDGGVFAGNAGSRIAFSGRVLAVALHRDGRLLCMGLSRGAAITPDRVRAQLMPELTPSPYHSKKEPQTAPVYQKPQQTAPTGGAGMGTRPQTAVPVAAQSADSRPAHADREAREPAQKTSAAVREPAQRATPMAVREPAQRATPMAVREPAERPTPMAVREPAETATPMAVRESTERTASTAALEPAKNGEREAADAPATAPVYQKPQQTAPTGGAGMGTRPQTAVPVAAQSADSRPAHADREAREPAQKTSAAVREPAQRATPMAVREPAQRATPMAVREPAERPTPMAVREPAETATPMAVRESTERTASTAALEPAKNGEREAADAPATAPVYQKPQQTETERRHADPEPKENPVSTIPPAPAMEPEEAAPAKTDLPQREKRGLPIGKTAAAGERSAAAAEQTAADTESFMALLRRADRAFAAVMHREPPAVPTAVQTGGMRRGARYEPDGEQRTAPAVQQSAQTIHPSERADADAERTNDFDGVARETLLRRAPDVGSPEQNKAGAIRQTVFDAAAPKPSLQRAPVTHPPQQTDAAGQSALGERPTPVQGTPILNGRRLHAETNDAAGDWYDEVERLLENEPPANRSEPIANPFPNIFPGAKFLSIQKPGVPAYLCGDWYSGRGPTGERMRITAVPGAYSPRPPAHLTGFTRYIRARTGGYWIRVEAWSEP